MAFIDRSTKFKNAMGAHLLKQLFFETTTDFEDKAKVLFTLKDNDHNGYPSLKRLYVEMEDTTEYEFANEYLDGFQHWKKLKACLWFKPYYEEMKEELSLKLRARHLRKVKELVEDEKSALQATKYLLEQDVVDKHLDKRGRPSKARIKEEADLLVKDHEDILADANRLGIN